MSKYGVCFDGFIHYSIPSYNINNEYFTSKLQGMHNSSQKCEIYCFACYFSGNHSESDDLGGGAGGTIIVTANDLTITGEKAFTLFTISNRMGTELNIMF